MCGMWRSSRTRSGLNSSTMLSTSRESTVARTFVYPARSRILCSSRMFDGSSSTIRRRAERMNSLTICRYRTGRLRWSVQELSRSLSEPCRRERLFEEGLARVHKAPAQHCILCIAGRKEYACAGPSAADPARELEAAHFRHHDVGDYQVDFRASLFARAQRIDAVSRFDDRVAVAA